MLYMIVEHFRNGDPKPVYRRFLDKGRLTPEGITYLSSWVDESMQHCFQLMETLDRNLINEWISFWNDITEFEVFPVITSGEALEKITPIL